MLKKRGQVTVYILIGIIIVALFLITVYFRDSLILDASEREIQVDPLLVHAKNFVDACILDIANDGIRRKHGSI